MTTLILGTSLEGDEVFEVARRVGFDVNTGYVGVRVPLHKSVEGLRLQIHEPSYFRGVDGINTAIEFDDLTDLFPENPGAIGVLRELNTRITDLQCREPFLSDNPSEIRSVSDYLDSLDTS